MEHEQFGALPTVKVVWDNPEGFCEINERDFDSAVHTKWHPKKGAAPKEQTAIVVDYHAMTKADIAAELDTMKVEHPSNANKDDLIALHKQALEAAHK